MNGFLQAILLGMARSGVMGLGGCIAAKGYLSGSDVTNFEGSLIFLIGAGFSVYDKLVVKKKIEAAGVAPQLPLTQPK